MGIICEDFLYKRTTDKSEKGVGDPQVEHGDRRAVYHLCIQKESRESSDQNLRREGREEEATCTEVAFSWRRPPIPDDFARRKTEA